MKIRRLKVVAPDVTDVTELNSGRLFVVPEENIADSDIHECTIFMKTDEFSSVVNVATGEVHDIRNLAHTDDVIDVTDKFTLVES